MTGSSQEETRRTIERVARESYGRLVAYLSSHTRDVAGAEDALSEALVAALKTWPRDGVPRKPEAWLLTTARHALIDRLRHEQVALASEPRLALLGEGSREAALAAEFPDERLKLLFVCAHPAIDPSLHTPLMLQTVLGLDAARIAQAFLVSPTTMSQRLVRAKTKIRRGVFPLKYPRSMICRRGSTLCWKPFTPPLGSAGRAWLEPTSTGPTWPRKPSGWPASCSSSCRTMRRCGDCSLSCSIAKRGGRRGAARTAGIFPFPRRTPGCGRSR